MTTLNYFDPQEEEALRDANVWTNMDDESKKILAQALQEKVRMMYSSLISQRTYGIVLSLDVSWKNLFVGGVDLRPSLATVLHMKLFD